jgi:hypothetical protein
MIRRMMFLSVLILFGIYTFFFAPESNIDKTWVLIKAMFLFDIQDVNPLNIVIFMSLGLFPFIISCVLLIDRLGQKVPVLPFIIASFALGGFALLPYFILREPNPPSQ